MSGDPTNGARVWGVVELSLTESDAELVLACVPPGALGARFDGGDAAPGRLSLYWATAEEAERAAQTIADALDRLGRAATVPRIRRLVDEPWVARYQASLRPFELGRRFLVRPGRIPIRSTAGRTVIELVPGRAFGTGEHPTTRLCAEALEDAVEPGSRWVDLGCGSGILAIVAVHCGAERVLAVDVDAEALEVASTVVRRNGVSRAIRFSCGSVESVAPGWDGVVANIAGSFFGGHAEALVSLLRPGGRLIAAGFTVDEASEVAGSLVAAGLERPRSEALAGWMRLDATRRED